MYLLPDVYLMCQPIPRHLAVTTLPLNNCNCSDQFVPLGGRGQPPVARRRRVDLGADRRREGTKEKDNALQDVLHPLYPGTSCLWFLIALNLLFFRF